MRWLINNVSEFPSSANDFIGDELFNGWCFIQGIDGVVYFANCIERGITASEFNANKKVANQTFKVIL